jgi:amidase
LPGLKIGLWVEEPGFSLDPEVRSVVEVFASQLGGLGCAVELIRPIDGPALLEAYRLLLSAVLAEDMPPAVQKATARMRPFVGLARRLGHTIWAARITGSTASHTEWLGANEIRARFALHLRGVFERYDLILAPIAPVTAFPHDHAPFGQRRLARSDGGTMEYAAMLNWISMATACGLPATAFPAGSARNGLPVGVQLIGARGGDAKVLSIAQAIEDALGGFVRPPPLAA